MDHVGRYRRATSQALRQLAPRRPGRAAAMALGVVAAGVAAALLNRHAGRKAERASPPAGRFVEAGGLRLHYLERGEGGPPVVLLHGNGAMAVDYDLSGVFQAAAARHRTIAFDRPGFGHSSRPRRRAWTPSAQAAVLAEAFRQLGLERPVVVGQSWGTMVALALALEHPEAVGGLVLVSGYYFPTVRADAVVFGPPAIPVIGDVLRYTIGPPLGRLMAPGVFRSMFSPQAVPARFAAGFPLPLALRPWQIRANAEEAALMVPAAASLAKRYGALRLPVAILAGEGDRIVGPEAQSVRLRGEVPQASLAVLPGLGHMLHHTVPDRVVAAIDEVASGIAAGRGRPGGRDGTERAAA